VITGAVFSPGASLRIPGPQCPENRSPAILGRNVGAFGSSLLLCTHVTSVALGHRHFRSDAPDGNKAW
jgi:hypothetical protein